MQAARIQYAKTLRAGGNFQRQEQRKEDLAKLRAQPANQSQEKNKRKPDEAKGKTRARASTCTKRATQRSGGIPAEPVTNRGAAGNDIKISTCRGTTVMC
jgi:hypothetical protein